MQQELQSKHCRIIAMKCDINEYCNNFNNKDIEYYLMNSKF